MNLPLDNPMPEIHNIWECHPQIQACKGQYCVSLADGVRQKWCAGQPARCESRLNLTEDDVGIDSR